MRYIYLFLFITSLANAQSKKFERMLKKNIKQTVPIVRVSEVNPETDYIFLDARELKEYKVSHIPKAFHIGYDYFKIEKIHELVPDKKTSILVYCSVGIRSELIGEKLKAAGYSDVSNLYGGIFEWKNQNKIVLDSIDNNTKKVHTFSKAWSKWLTNGERIYEK
jgi:rhodanese-related sulfurtransferase